MIALTLLLTLEDRERFQRSRDVGCYVGLRPKRRESGDSQPPLRITKEGDVYLRKLLVQGAYYIGSQSPSSGDCEVAAERALQSKDGQFDAEMGPFQMEDTNWHRSEPLLRVRMEAGRVGGFQMLS